MTRQKLHKNSTVKAKEKNDFQKPMYLLSIHVNLIKMKFDFFSTNTALSSAADNECHIACINTTRILNCELDLILWSMKNKQQRSTGECVQFLKVKNSFEWDWV